MEFVVWVYKPLEQSQIDQLLGSSMDLSVKYDKNSVSKEPKQPLSRQKAELVLYGAALNWIRPSMEYQRVQRKKFLREPLLGRMDDVYLGEYFSEGSEYEEVGISTLHIKGRLFYASHEVYDSLKLMQWANEDAGDKDKGFRTVVFASLQDQRKQDEAPVNYRKIIFPKAFVVRYEEHYNDQDGMGMFEAVFQQSTAELMDCGKNIAEAAWKDLYNKG